MEGELPPPRHRRAVRSGLLAVVLVLGVGAVWVIRTYPPADTPFLPRCQFHSLTGLHCAGCGLTRSAHSLLNGDLSQAVAWHPLSPVLLPVLAVVVGRALWRWAVGATAGRRRSELPAWVVWVAFAFVILFSVLRNVPAAPFDQLAPHQIKSP